MKTFFDSSAYAKRFVEERGSHVAEEICRKTSTLALSIISVPEIISALSRRLRDKRINSHDYLLAKERLMEEVNDVVIVNITPSVVTRVLLLLESHSLPTMDAIHIACAMEWDSDLFVSSDRRQIDAAQNVGLTVNLI